MTSRKWEDYKESVGGERSEWFKRIDQEVQDAIKEGLNIKQYMESVSDDVKWKPVYSIKVGLFVHYYVESKNA